MCRIAVLLLTALAAALSAQTSYQDLLKASDSPENWLTYSGGYAGIRHSRLTDITPQNAGDLEMKWVYQNRASGKFEATPLVVDGVMYFTEPPNDVIAVDALTGRVFWEYRHPIPPGTTPCCGAVNRGLAALDGLLYMATIDCRIIAFDANTGRKQWEKQICDYRTGYALAHAPLAVKDKILVGTAGGEFGIRGFLAAYDAKNGEEVWKFHTIPGLGEPGHETWENDAWKRGGTSIWLTGSYDPELNLTYWGVGNPSPDWNPDVRPGDNLYSDSVIALDVDSGELKWHFQFTPHDEWDWDAVQIPVLVDRDWKGKRRRLMLWGNRNGFFYVLDRESGKFLHGSPFVKQTWAAGLDEEGRPVKVHGKGPSAKGSLTFPGVQGGTNWYSPSYNPMTDLFYLAVWDDYSSVYYKWDQEYQPGLRYLGGSPKSTVEATRRTEPNVRDTDTGYGAVRALDPDTGEMRWEFKVDDVSESGLLTTASNVLFSGSREGHFFALDARDGELLWTRYLGGQIAASPITYRAGGKQYVAIASGRSLFVFGLK